LYLKRLIDNYKEWSENKFTRYIISKPEDLHLLWALQRSFLINAGNNMSIHLPSMAYCVYKVEQGYSMGSVVRGKDVDIYSEKIEKQNP
jgi:hypothetical protein